MREKLGIKQNIKKSDIEDFKSEGYNVENFKLEPTATPKSTMLLNGL